MRRRCDAWKWGQAASAVLHEGEQTNWVLPTSLRDFNASRERCLPQMKHDMVAALKTPGAAKGDPPALER